MQIYGIIKQSASDRLPGGNHGARAVNVSTGRCWSINSTIIKLNILNAHIYYVREDLFDLAVDLQLQR